MKKEICELKQCYNKLFDDAIYNQCFIEIDDDDNVVLSANKEGLLLLIEEIITLCEKGQPGTHYHLDEAGMASRCAKPLIIQLIKAPWQND